MRLKNIYGQKNEFYHKWQSNIERGVDVVSLQGLPSPAYVLGMPIDKIENRTHRQKLSEKIKKIEFLHISSTNQDQKLEQKLDQKLEQKLPISQNNIAVVPSCKAVSVKIIMYKKGSKQFNLGSDPSSALSFQIKSLDQDIENQLQKSIKSLLLQNPTLPISVLNAID